MFKINNNGSDDGSKTCIQPDESLMPFFAPTDGEEPNKLGAGQCTQHALLVEIPWGASNFKCLAVVFLFSWQLSDLNFSNCFFLLF